MRRIAVQGIKGIGPKTALKLVQQHGRLEAMPEYIGRLGDVSAVRRIFLEPAVTEHDGAASGSPDVAGITAFLCGAREFAEDRVTAALVRAFGRPTLF